MSVAELELEIEVLTDERNERRRMRKPVKPIQDQLDEAWDQLRRARAAAMYGTNDQINRTARVERELEKLMGVEA